MRIITINPRQTQANQPLRPAHLALLPPPTQIGLIIARLYALTQRLDANKLLKDKDHVS